MPLQVDLKDIPPIGDTADSLITVTNGQTSVCMNRKTTPYEFDARDPRVVTMTSFDGTPVGEFIGPGAEDNALRLCVMLRLCDGVGTDVLSRIWGKLSEILDTDLFPSAKKMLISRDYVLGSGEQSPGVCMPPEVAAEAERLFTRKETTHDSEVAM